MYCGKTYIGKIDLTSSFLFFFLLLIWAHFKLCAKFALGAVVFFIGQCWSRRWGNSVIPFCLWSISHSYCPHVPLSIGTFLMWIEIFFYITSITCSLGPFTEPLWLNNIIHIHVSVCWSYSQAGIIPCAFAFGATYIKNRDLSITAQSGVVVSGGRPPMKTDRPGFLISVGYGCSRPLFHKEGHSLSCNAALLFSGLHFYLDYWNSAANTIRINWNFKNLNCSFSKTEIITSLRVFWLSKKN